MLRILVLLSCISILSAGCEQKATNYRIDHEYNVSDPQFPRVMGHLLGPPLVEGNRVTTFLNGDQIFPAMLSAIHEAQKTITFETYVYWRGEVGKQFSDAFAERAHAGV